MDALKVLPIVKVIPFWMEI